MAWRVPLLRFRECVQLCGYSHPPPGGRRAEGAPLNRRESCHTLAQSNNQASNIRPMTLNRQECRELFEAIEKSGLDPSEFELVNAMHARWTHIIHTPSNDCQNIARSNDHEGQYAIVLNRPPFYLRFVAAGMLRAYDWPEVVEMVEDWASQLSAARDIWKEFINDRATVTASHENIDNTLFTASEREAVRKQLREIPAQAQECFDLSEKQESDIEQKMDELIAASERVGKKDWRVMVYGAAFSLIVNDEIPAHAVQSIMSMIFTGLAHSLVFGGLPPLMP